MWCLQRNRRSRRSRHTSILETDKETKTQNFAHLPRNPGRGRNNPYRSGRGVAKNFANYYQNIYTPLEDVQFDPDFKSKIDLEMKHIIATCESDIHDLPGGCITTKELNSIIGCLKLRKAPGYDSITNEHIVHGGNHLFDASLIYTTPSCLGGKYHLMETRTYSAFVQGRIEARKCVRQLQTCSLITLFI